MLKVLLLALAIATPILAFHSYPGCPGDYNSQPIIEEEPKLISSVKNGKRYLINSTVNGTHLAIVALQGSWYDMGFAYGQLMKTEINDALPGMFNYLVERIDDLLLKLKDLLPFFLKWIPNLLKLAPRDLLHALLDLQYTLSAKYIPARFDEQLKGVAAGSGADLKFLRKMNLLPELIRAACSIAGIWGPATADGNLLQLRALDWEFEAYLVNYPEAIIYFPTEKDSNPFATFGFSSFIGAISGYSPKIAISEKVWLPISTDPLSEFGEPFAYMLRDLLQFGDDLKSSVDILYKTPRTCKIHIGIGSKDDNSFLGFQSSFNVLDIFTDKNYTYTEAHPQLDGVMFWDKHPQPSKDQCLGAIFKDNHGKMDAEFVWRQAAALHRTGDTQTIVYDFQDDLVYISYSDPKTKTVAYVRPMIKLHMDQLLTYGNHF